jgi:hypothetical protein
MEHLNLLYSNEINHGTSLIIFLSLFLRSFFVSWVLYCLAVSTVFQTFVASFLVDPGLERQVSSVEDILNSGLSYGMYRTFKGFLDGLPKKQSDVLLTRAEECVRIVECAENVAKHGNYATILAGITAEYLNTYKTVDDKGTALLYILDMKVWTNFLVFMFPKGSGLLSMFNRHIRAAQEAGLVTYFWRDMLTTSKMKTGSIRVPTLLDDYTVFSLTYLQSAFILLALGYCSALCMLLAELWCNWWAMRRRKMAVNYTVGDLQSGFNKPPGP